LTNSLIETLDARHHGLTRERVSPHALEVTATLQQAGFAGLIVGGCVRDLLLGLTPKDFDVATDATPEQVRGLFRRSRLVGRRFRIAHVRSGRELIEVSTFRRGSADDADERAHSEAGMILRDNVYGTLEEDAFRRDFTINALYYDPHQEHLLDYVGGLRDLEGGRLRFIGDAPTRIREDPVRALRAIRFQAKLGCSLDAELHASLAEAADLMEAVPPARLFDEAQKLLMSGHAGPAWDLLAPTPLLGALFPTCNPADPLIARAMLNTDERIRADKPVTPGFLLAVVLWGDYQARVTDAGATSADARLHAAQDCLADQQQIVAIPRRFTQFMREVWLLQERLEARLPRGIERLAGHARFRAAYDFLLLRAEADPDLAEAADWWTEFQDAGTEDRRSLIDQRRAKQPPRKRRRRRRRSSAARADG
jgi:poly(A) polymerase